MLVNSCIFFSWLSAIKVYFMSKSWDPMLIKVIPDQNISIGLDNPSVSDAQEIWVHNLFSFRFRICFYIYIFTSTWISLWTFEIQCYINIIFILVAVNINKFIITLLTN